MWALQSGACTDSRSVRIPCPASSSSNPVRCTAFQAIDEWHPRWQDAVNWLRVFAYIARGAEGPFVLAEDPDQLARACGIKRDGISPGLRANLRPPQVVFIDGAQTFVHARILYADKLFETAFRVGRPDPDCGDLWAGGEVEMIHDEPIGPAGVRCEMTLASVRMSRFEV